MTTDAAPIITKVCTRCREAKPLGEYHRHPQGAHGRQPRCKDCARDGRGAYYTPEKRRARHLQRTYGLSVEQYAELARQQGMACAICEQVPDRALAVDHCHDTGRVRGLLCTPCNSALGRFGDDAERLQRAIRYLQRGST